jgi:hypothetical protein
MKIKENTKYKHCLMNLHTSVKSNSKTIVVWVFISQKANKPTTNTDQFNSLLVKIMFFKLNSQGNPWRVDFGVLIRNGGGDWVVGFSGFLVITNNTFAELMVLYHGLKIARASDYHCFLCYFDSKVVFDLVTNVVDIANILDLLKLDLDDFEGREYIC